MKKVIMFVLLLTGLVMAQLPSYYITLTKPLTVTLTSNDSTLIYFVFPNKGGNYYFSETLPTASTFPYFQGWASGDFDICMEPNKSSGNSDSLNVKLLPLMYDPYDKEYVIPKNDSLFLWFDSLGTYTGLSARWLDYTVTKEYHATVSGDAWPLAGFAIRPVHKNAGTLTLPFWIYFVKEER